MDAKYLAEIKALTADAESELRPLGVALTAPAISVNIFNDISPKTASNLRKLASLANVYIPALLGEVERLTAENHKQFETIGRQGKEMNRRDEIIRKQDQQIAMLKKALELAEDMLTKMTPFKSKGGWHDRLIQQAQEQEGKK